MENLLEKINSTKDLKKLSNKEKNELCNEIREYIIDVVSKNGGHLASNLGIVELTIALHSVFNVPKDKIIWDVGHQTYVHKIITGRRKELKNLRKLNCVSGFPKTEESEADCFDTGHSSTSISVALGMAKARDLKREKSNVIAVIGDGALTGGMAMEALNDAGCSKTNLIVILNDNAMSISKNVGGMSLFLNKLRARKFYRNSNNYVKRFFQKIPFIGKKIILFTRKTKHRMKQFIYTDSSMYFEDIGFRYFGPIDGHDISKIENMLKAAKNMEGPILIHVITKKGKGYKPAEDNPDKFHSTPKFDKDTGEKIESNVTDYSEVFGKKLIELAKQNKKIVAITASMKDGTGLTAFSKKYPSRFFDAGIAEQHAIGMAAGMAKNGLIPVVPIYSTFYQRAFDQVIHDVCIQKLPVVLCVDRAGIVGNDGETHQGIFDLSYFSIIPNLEVLAPKDFKELEDMLEYAINLKSPIVIRYPKGKEGSNKFEIHKKIEKGKSELIKEGKDISIIAIGKMVSRAVEISEKLKDNNIDAEIINVRFLKPIDKNSILKSISKTKKVVTMEDNILEGGLASKINDLLAKNELGKIDILNFGYPDKFIKHGTISEIEKKYGLDTDTIYRKIINELF